jgi:GH24 family phage-related lysozyme (muramidase)
MHQRDLFSQNTIHNINIFHEAPKTESRTDGSQVKLTPTQKQALQSICREHNIGVSTFISDALDHFIEIFPYREKIKRHKSWIKDFVKLLP